MFDINSLIVIGIIFICINICLFIVKNAITLIYEIYKIDNKQHIKDIFKVLYIINLVVCLCAAVINVFFLTSYRAKYTPCEDKIHAVIDCTTNKPLTKEDIHYINESSGDVEVAKEKSELADKSNTEAMKNSIELFKNTK